MSGMVQTAGKAMDVKESFVKLTKALEDSRIQQGKMQSDSWPKGAAFRRHLQTRRCTRRLVHLGRILTEFSIFADENWLYPSFADLTVSL